MEVIVDISLSSFFPLCNLSLFHSLLVTYYGTNQASCNDSPASSMISLRAQNVSTMQSFMECMPTSTLRDLLVEAEEEAMRLFEKETAECNETSMEEHGVCEQTDLKVDFPEKKDYTVESSMKGTIPLDKFSSTQSEANKSLSSVSNTSNDKTDETSSPSIFNEEDVAFTHEAEACPHTEVSVDEDSPCRDPVSTASRRGSTQFAITQGAVDMLSACLTEVAVCSTASKSGEKEESNLEERLASLKNCWYLKALQKYQARIKYHESKSALFLGSYELKSDAAFAHDKASMMLSGHFTNFETMGDYSSIRELEAKSRGISVDLDETLAFMDAKVSI